MSVWFSDHWFDPAHRDALLTYTQHESGFDPTVIVRTGACLPQWAGERRRFALEVGHGACPAVSWQFSRIHWELWNIDAFRCFWHARSYGEALSAIRKGFGAGHC